jgi:hypothetical protein
MKKYLRLIFALLLLSQGCATPPGPYIQGRPYEGPVNRPISDPRYPQVEVGRDVKVINGLGHYFFSLVPNPINGWIPSKLLLWSWRVDKHWISQDVTDDIGEYLQTNNLNDTKARINQYAPIREFRRLKRNYRVGPGYRWTLGLISWIQYTVFPGKLLGGDNYNPYTNTLNIYSDLSAIAYHEGGHAKDLSWRRFKGTYQLLYMIPVYKEVFEYRASRDAIRYSYYKKEKKNELGCYKVLCPAFGSYVGGEFGFLPIYAVSVITGHVIGRIKASKRNSYYDTYLVSLDLDTGSQMPVAQMASEE